MVLRCFLECKALVSCRFSYLPKLKLLLRHLTSTHIYSSAPAQKLSREGPEVTSSYAEYCTNKKPTNFQNQEETDIQEEYRAIPVLFQITLHVSRVVARNETNLT